MLAGDDLCGKQCDGSQPGVEQGVKQRDFGPHGVSLHDCREKAETGMVVLTTHTADKWTVTSVRSHMDG